MENSGSNGYNFGGEQNNRNESSPNWTEVAAVVAVAFVAVVFVERVAAIAGGLFRYLSSSSSAYGSGSITCWQFPPKGWIKCNVDGSFLREKRSAGCGGVFRDAQGNWLSGFAEKIDYYDNTLAEAFAVYRGLKEAWLLDYRKVVIESDSESMVKLVNELSDTSGPLAELVNEIIDYKSRKNWEVQVVHVPKEINKVAYRLARYLSHKLLLGKLEIYEDPPEDEWIDHYLTDGVSGKQIELT